MGYGIPRPGEGSTPREKDGESNLGTGRSGGGVPTEGGSNVVVDRDVHPGR